VLSMAGGLAGLTQVFTTDEATRINALGDGLRAQLNSAAVSRGAPFQATGVGSLIGLHFADCETQEAIENLFHLEMIERGFYFSRRGYIALSLPTTAADCDAFASAVGEFLSLRGSLIPGNHRQDELRRVL
jgi:glutamate-1-semialdehyde 2,1-aminomutase